MGGGAYPRKNVKTGSASDPFRRKSAAAAKRRKAAADKRARKAAKEQAKRAKARPYAKKKVKLSGQAGKPKKGWF